MKNADIIFQEKNILVLGMGITGIDVTRTLAGLGNHITCLDNNASLDPARLRSMVGQVPEGDIEVVLAHDADEGLLEGIDLVLTSPGIPSSHKFLLLAQQKSIPVWDELELSSRLLRPGQRSRLAAVTGTNGKTTVVNLIGSILGRAGLENRVCGNVGSPLLDTIKIDRDSKQAHDDDIIRVVEVSSFQLERTHTFRPFVSVLLNITSDHMDRHGSVEEYARTKMKLFDCQGTDDHAVINMDDSMASSLASRVGNMKQGPRVIRYGLGPDNDVWYDESFIHYDIRDNKGKIDIKGALLKGSHNMSNAAASAAAALLMGADPDDTGEAIKAFRPLGHRMEYLGQVSGIKCINDSKSTNPDSLIAALKDFSGKVTLIMGGLDKEMDFRPVIPYLKTSVDSIILIGSSAERMQRLFGRETGISIHICRSMEDAVEKGFNITARGGVLLLSPGCASMDMFDDYRDRGDRFKKAVLGKRHDS